MELIKRLSLILLLLCTTSSLWSNGGLQFKGKLRILRPTTLQVKDLNGNLVLTCSISQNGVFETEKKVTVEEVNAALKEAADGHVLCYTEEPLVSSDYIGSHQSSTVDALLTRVMGDNMVKVISWYDNECGYSTRLAETTLMVAEKL